MQRPPVLQQHRALGEALGEDVAGGVRARGRALAALALHSVFMKLTLQEALPLVRRRRRLHNARDARRRARLGLVEGCDGGGAEAIHLSMRREDCKKIQRAYNSHSVTLHKSINKSNFSTIK